MLKDEYQSSLAMQFSNLYLLDTKPTHHPKTRSKKILKYFADKFLYLYLDNYLSIYYYVQKQTDHFR